LPEGNQAIAGEEYGVEKEEVQKLGILTGGEMSKVIWTIRKYGANDAT
jgi:hypothetical protein